MKKNKKTSSDPYLHTSHIKEEEEEIYTYIVSPCFYRSTFITKRTKKGKKKEKKKKKKKKKKKYIHIQFHHDSTAVLS